MGEGRRRIVRDSGSPDGTFPGGLPDALIGTAATTGSRASRPAGRPADRELRPFLTFGSRSWPSRSVARLVGLRLAWARWRSLIASVRDRHRWEESYQRGPPC